MVAVRALSDKSMGLYRTSAVDPEDFNYLLTQLHKRGHIEGELSQSSLRLISTGCVIIPVPTDVLLDLDSGCSCFFVFAACKFLSLREKPTVAACILGTPLRLQVLLLYLIDGWTGAIALMCTHKCGCSSDG